MACGLGKATWLLPLYCSISGLGYGSRARRSSVIAPLGIFLCLGVHGGWLWHSFNSSSLNFWNSPRPWAGRECTWRYGFKYLDGSPGPSLIDLWRPSCLRLVRRHFFFLFITNYNNLLLALFFFPVPLSFWVHFRRLPFTVDAHDNNWRFLLSLCDYDWFLDPLRLPLAPFWVSLYFLFSHLAISYNLFYFRESQRVGVGSGGSRFYSGAAQVEEGSAATACRYIITLIWWMLTRLCNMSHNVSMCFLFSENSFLVEYIIC